MRKAVYADALIHKYELDAGGVARVHQSTFRLRQKNSWKSTSFFSGFYFGADVFHDRFLPHVRMASTAGARL